ncbi:hypothetical protein DICVIV_02810 [Dictyocaulus viviparus]|uniref:Uncharacterized protein n=1 Tax=Dictyocaulus viviparus TaxID=29172 RepID=A0A0D8Y4W3_DICVI|nr:hypothetical protein DICVIV_02810 [Dictyocaulus viviparus]
MENLRRCSLYVRRRSELICFPFREMRWSNTDFHHSSSFPVEHNGLQQSGWLVGSTESTEYIVMCSFKLPHYDGKFIARHAKSTQTMEKRNEDIMAIND